MTNEELKRALVTRAPVIYEEPGEAPHEYERVRAIVYRLRADMKGRRECRSGDMPGIAVCAELLDRSGHSVTTVDPANLRFAGAGLPKE